MKSILLASIILVLGAGGALAMRSATFSMRDGSTIVMVGDCLVQYGRGDERINNGRRCSGGDLRAADRIASGGRTDAGPAERRMPRRRVAVRGGPGEDLPGGSWAETCRDGHMRGAVLQARCRSDFGRWSTTRLDMRRCSAGRAENHDGMLICD